MMRKSKLCVMAVFLGIFLTSCQESNQISPTNTMEPIAEKTLQVSASSLMIPINTVTPTLLQPASPSPIPVVLPSRTPQPEPTPTFLPLGNLNERGTLWILQQYRSTTFDRLNLDNGEITPMVGGVNCDDGLRPGTEQTICESSTRSVLRNLTTGEEQQLPIKNTCRFYGWSPNGRFLLYEYCRGQDSYTIASYDLLTQTEHEIAMFSQSWEEREWYAIPQISYDGLHLVVNSIKEINYKTSESQQFVVPELPVTDDFSLSPIANQIVYGATDIKQEIGIRPNHLFIYDFDSRENRLLATAPEGKLYDMFYSTPIWSPDGSKVVVSSGSSLCVIEIVAQKQTCHDLSPYEVLSFMTWSPGSQSIALIAARWGTPASDLVIFDVSKESYFVFLSEMKLDAETLDILFWR